MVFEYRIFCASFWDSMDTFEVINMFVSNKPLDLK